MKRAPSLQRLSRCERGSAAVEFAIVAPLLILCHLGMVEMVQAWEAHRRVNHIASAVADLTAQKRTVTSAELNDILSAGSLLIAPFPASRLGTRVSSFSMGSGGALTRDWTSTRNWTAGGSPSLPAGYLRQGESVIAVEVVYSHSALFGLVLPGAVTLRKQAYLRPRLSNQVSLVGV